jgi:Cu+-exporting ATPase
MLGEFTPALMRSIAVLVIACPCAMGLATPAAIAVGLGRAARKGILFRNAKSLEVFKDIKQVVFDKTGTLTTGRFKIGNYKSFIVRRETSDVSERSSGNNPTHVSPLTSHDNNFKSIACSLEKYSNHPVAKSIAEEWKTKDIIPWKRIEEVKGLGMKAEDQEGKQP